MRKLVFFLLVSFLSGSLLAQKQIDDANAQVRQVGSFHGIRSSHGITVYLTQGSTEVVAVSANDTEYRDKIKTVVENGILKIYYDNDDWKTWKNNGNKKLRAYVSAKDINAISVSSGSEMKIEGALKSGNLKINTSSGATLHGKVEAQSLDVDQSSGSTINLSGVVNGSLTVEGSSGSVFRGYDLTVETCDAETSSGAGVQVTVNKELTVEASSGGYIHFKGNGLIRDVHTSSGGSVSRKS
jgi:hypothetical protein